jgi:hypothetical protein
MRCGGWLTLLCCAALMCLATAAWGQDVGVAYKVRGFTTDQKQMLLEVNDVAGAGPVLRVFDVETALPAKKSQPIAFGRSEGPKAARDARKRFKMVDAGVEDMLYPLDPADETKSLSFFGLMAAKDRFVLAVTDKQRLGKIKDVPVKFDEESKVLAKVSLRSIYCTADRKLLVAVVTQRIDTGSFVSESDQLHVVRFDPKAIQWVDPTPDPPAAK